jgi:hypothetical protein
MGEEGIGTVKVAAARSRSRLPVEREMQMGVRI